MFENLERSFSSPLKTPADSAIPLAASDRFTLFTDKTVTQMQPYVASVVSSAFFKQLFKRVRQLHCTKICAISRRSAATSGGAPDTRFSACSFQQPVSKVQ
jgi:hypothetical protein